MKRKPELKLNKKTIARLNNMEMRHILGGDGDEEGGGISRNMCGKEEDIDKKKSILNDAMKILATQAITVCVKGD